MSNANLELFRDSPRSSQQRVHEPKQAQIILKSDRSLPDPDYKPYRRSSVDERRNAAFYRRQARQHAFQSRVKGPEAMEHEYRFLKSRMLQAPKYKAYRENVRRASETVWDDTSHELFLRAAVKYPHSHRAKFDGKEYSISKKLGRNEIIALFMMRHLNMSEAEFCRKHKEEPRSDAAEKKKRKGQNREKPDPRKVISSHIQVLKKFFNNEFYFDAFPFVYLGKPGDNKKKDVISSSDAHLSPGMIDGTGHQKTAYNEQQVLNSSCPLNIFGTPRLPKILRSQADLAAEPSRLQLYPYDFSISIQSQPDEKLVHTITRMKDSLPITNRRLVVSGDRPVGHPGLMKMYHEGLLTPESNVYLAESSFCIDACAFSDHELAVSSTFRGQDETLHDRTLICRTQYFDITSLGSGQKPWQMQCVHERTDKVSIGLDEDGKWSYGLSMGSEWLVRKYIRWANEIGHYQSTGREAKADMIIRERVEQLYALQTVTCEETEGRHNMTNRAGVSSESVVLIVSWKFTAQLKDSPRNAHKGLTRFTKALIDRKEAMPTIRTCLEQESPCSNVAPGGVETRSQPLSLHANDKQAQSLADAGSGLQANHDSQMWAIPSFDEIHSAQILDPSLSFDSFFSQAGVENAMREASGSGPRLPDVQSAGSDGGSCRQEHWRRAGAQDHTVRSPKYDQAVMDQMAAITAQACGEFGVWTTDGAGEVQSLSSKTCSQAMPGWLGLSETAGGSSMGVGNEPMADVAGYWAGADGLEQSHAGGLHTADDEYDVHGSSSRGGDRQGQCLPELPSQHWPMAELFNLQADYSHQLDGPTLASPVPRSAHQLNMLLKFGVGATSAGHDGCFEAGSFFLPSQAAMDGSTVGAESGQDR